jgi:ataxia telangiectasia mutated family protein
MVSYANSDSIYGLSQVKDRTQGLADLRDIFATPSNIDAIDNDRNMWLVILQSLFSVVINERNTCFKKATAVAERRLADGARTLRHIVERCAPRIPRKAIKALFNHLIQLVVVKQKLYEPLALDYLKSLSAVLSHQPHLEHLDVQQWKECASLCFAALFGDEIRVREFVDEDLMDVDDDGYLEDGGKVLRIIGADVVDASHGNPMRMGLEQVELMTCLELLFRSPAAPFTEYAAAILTKLIRFFSTYRVETQAHLSAVAALNLCLAAIELNARRSMINASSELWQSLINLWNTKFTALKEQIVIGLRYLYPFIVTQSPAISEHTLRSLYDSVIGDSENRFRTEDLVLDNLRLSAPSGDLTLRQAFETSTVRHGHAFSAGQALAWSSLELGADALAKLYALSESVRPAVVTSPDGRSKRRKVINDL